MADVRITPQKLLPTGVTPAFTGSLLTTNVYVVRNTGRCMVEVKKSGAGACDVTIDTPGSVGGLAIAQQVVNVIATTGDKMIGPFPPNIYNDGSGDVRITFSEITGLTMAVVEF